MRLRRVLLLTLYLFALLAVFSTGACGTAPTLPDQPAFVLSGPAFVVSPPNERQQALALAWWTEQAACVGVLPTVAVRVPIDVVPEPFDCAGYVAAGCWRAVPLSITVVARWFEPAVSHELIHYALWRKGEDPGHSNPAFARCDRLNYVARSVPSPLVWRCQYGD